jgi:hypothetical protein
MQELKDKYVGQFIGPDKISDIIVTDFTTPLGSMVFEVTYETGMKELYAEKGLTVVVSKEAKDFNHVRDARVSAMVPQIVDLVIEYDLPLVQHVYFLGQVGEQLKNRLNRAQSFLIHGTDERFIPGFDPMTDMTLLDAERVIAKIPPKTDDA